MSSQIIQCLAPMKQRTVKTKTVVRKLRTNDC